VEGCGKTYKNPNGLKYHMLHGHARPGKEGSSSSSSSPSSSSSHAASEAGRGEKPYRCPFGTCSKQYKNANGLKYHMQHGHTGQTPPMRRTISSLRTISGLSQIEAALKREQAIRAAAQIALTSHASSIGRDHALL
jgi:hypothetical protein